jgi:outer membrane protein OmpA-like peptidoglycan-associated protein
VAEYSPSIAVTATVGPFTANSSVLSRALKAKITNLAEEIMANGDTAVVLVGFSDNLETNFNSLDLSRARAIAVDRYLKVQLDARKVTGVTISAVGAGSLKPSASNSTPVGRAMNRRVVSWITGSS